MAKRAKQTVKITKRLIDSLTTDNPYGERHYDSEISGFGVWVSPTGKRSYFLDYGPNKRRRRITLGHHTSLPVSKARIKAIKTLGRIADGEDPLESRRRRRDAITFGDWPREYLVDIESRKRSTRDDQRYLSDCIKRWGSRPMDTVTSDDITRAFETWVERGRVTCNRWLASVRACLAAAWRRELIRENPALRVRPMPEPQARQRVLSDDELHRFVYAVDKLSSPFARAALIMLIGSGCRLSECLRAKWEDVNLDSATWTIPRAKSGKIDVKPLPPPVVETLRALPRPGPYIIAGRDPNKPRTDLKRGWETVKRIADLQDVRIHDLRRTFGAIANRNAGLDATSKLLGHSDYSVTSRIYSPRPFDELAKVSESVAQVGLAKIIPFKAASVGDDE